MFAALSSGLALGQATAPAPQHTSSSVAIENTNAAFVATDIDIPQANPARPTVTTPAHIPPTGFLQLEQGFVHAGRSPAGTQDQHALSQVTKIAITTRLMVQFLTLPYTRSTLAGPAEAAARSTDPGDLQLGLQGVLHKAVGPVPTVSLGYIRRLRSGTSANLDQGAYSQSALILLGGDLPGSIHYDSNFIVDEQNDGPARRGQFLQTLALTHSLFPLTTRQHLSGIVELSHFTQPFVTTTHDGSPVSHPNAYDLLFVAAYAVRPNLILDASVDRGLTTTSTVWQGGFGFSYIFPHRLWPDRHPRVLSVGRPRLRSITLPSQ